MAGFVKFYREILDHPVAHKDNDYLAVWIYILLNANFDPGQADFNGETITLNPGQMIRGRKMISSKCSVSESKVERILNRLETEQMIEQRKTPNKRLITVLNWMSYQQSEQQSGQRPNNDRTTTEQRLDTNKKDKKEKKEKNNTNIGVFAQYAADNLPLLKALGDFDAMRKDIKKPLSDRARQLLCNKLTELSSQGENIIDCLNESVLHNWQGVFAKKKDQRRVEPIPDYDQPKTMSADEIEALKERMRNL